jgi:hypothetical protein
MKNVRTKGNYNEIFPNNISSETAMMMHQSVALGTTSLVKAKRMVR